MSTDYLQLLHTARYHAHQRHDFIEAERCFRKVVALKPNHAEALAGVGQGLFWRHRRAEGLRYMQKAAKALLKQAQKTDAKTLLDFAEQLQLWGELDLALQLTRAVLKQQPKHPKAQFHLAACLHRLNHLDQAITEMEKLLKQLPDDAACQILMAIMEFDNKQVTEAGLRLEKLLLTELLPLQQARAQLELAKIYDKQKRYDQAFSALTVAGELQRQLPGYQQINTELVFNKIAVYKQGFDQALLKRWSSADYADQYPKPVFLIGFLRSGTTLTEQVLSAHSNIITSDENELISELIYELENLTGIKDNLPKAISLASIEQLKQLRQLYWQRAAEEYSSKVYQKCFVNKVALNSIETGFISCVFPEAKILFALRDPRDICLSCAMQSFTATPGTINMLSWHGIARQYHAVMDLWLYLKPKIACDYLELRYEDTVKDFENSFRKVFSFLALNWEADVSQFHQQVTGKVIATPSFSAVSQPVYQTAVARWTNYQNHFVSIMPYLQPYIQAFAYQ